MSKQTNPISFEYEGQRYFIDFKYHRKAIQTWDGKVEVSKNPYTTVFIMKDMGPELESDEIFLSHTVGATPKTNFSRPDGRIWALRAVGRTLSPEFREAMWGAYMKRAPKRDKRGKVIQG